MKTKVISEVFECIKDSTNTINVLCESDIKLPDRKGVTNKGDAGRLLVIGGAIGMAGAVVFSPESAYRSGAGLVSILCDRENRTIVQTLIPEAVVAFWDDFDFDRINDFDSIVLGVGMGKSNIAGDILRRVLRSAEKPLIIDADALNIISESPELFSLLNERTVLTPHLAEFSRLCKMTVSDVKANAVTLAHDFAKRYSTNLVLKDNVSVFSDASGNLFALDLGNSTLSKGGTGDILTGIIASLSAGGLLLPEAVKSALIIHAMAGVSAGESFGERGALARDIIGFIPKVLKGK